MKVLIIQKILESLYEAWERNNHSNLQNLCQTNNWDWDVCEDIIDELENKRLIKHYAQWFYEITSDGIIFAEKQLIIPKETARKHIQIRQKILFGLKKFREENGRHERIYYKELCEKNDIEHSLFGINSDFLRDLGYIKSVTIGCYQITDEGMKRT